MFVFYGVSAYIFLTAHRQLDCTVSFALHVQENTGLKIS